jgi:hypothetical protein
VRHAVVVDLAALVELPPMCRRSAAPPLKQTVNHASPGGRRRWRSRRGGETDTDLIGRPKHSAAAACPLS